MSTNTNTSRLWIGMTGRIVCDAHLPSDLAKNATSRSIGTWLQRWDVVTDGDMDSWGDEAGSMRCECCGAVR
jgi:hypothetical protein